jgi:transporter family-2 protein
MKNVVFVGGITALVTGIFIGIQSMFSGRAGEIIGPINTGFWTNFLGGSLAGLLILGIGVFKGFNTVTITPSAIGMVLLSGALGIFIIMGVSFSISKAGLAAGMAAIILGQMVFGALSDTFGWGGLNPIPLDTQRIVGLILMAVSVILLFPKK